MIPSRAMYCQTSSSVQSESGNALRCSPGITLVWYRCQNSGRRCFGSHWPKVSRNDRTRSLALALSSSRLAPPMHASKECSMIRLKGWSSQDDSDCRSDPGHIPILG